MDAKVKAKITFRFELDAPKAVQQGLGLPLPYPAAWVGTANRVTMRARLANPLPERLFPGEHDVQTLPTSRANCSSVHDRGLWQWCD